MSCEIRLDAVDFWLLAIEMDGQPDVFGAVQRGVALLLDDFHAETSITFYEIRGEVL